ncbi:STM3941 family protein [Carnobacterium maltaromaticum]|uniref:STM3941 family protein n=1 Tax=Carnobacterium maltaromaticum TaxID=2751 RepID=UPI0010720DF6|nr:STM3941 family protein [Carnobacterium maltaromaticum]TFJ75625.1 hypothetical protein CKN94_05600 [Carnobacterium maltaromaticum]TFJ78792.1 hypothetical protein CKN97_05595 [Carnobacterium maltaromaticum]
MRIILVNNTEKKSVKQGQDFMALFFGFISPLFKKDIKWASIFLLIQIVTSIISYRTNFQLSYLGIFAQVFMGSSYNSIYTKELLKKGWVPETPEDRNKLLRKGFMSDLEIPVDKEIIKNEGTNTINLSQNEPIEYRISSQAKIKKFLFSFVFLMGAAFLFWIFLTKDITELELLAVLIGFSFCMILFFIFVSTSIKTIQHTLPTLVINEEGIEIETLGYQLGFISWSEIEAIKVISSGNSIFISFELVYKEVFVEKYRGHSRIYNLLTDELIGKKNDSINLSSQLFPVTIDLVYESSQKFFIPYLEKNR